MKTSFLIASLFLLTHKMGFASNSVLKVGPHTLQCRNAAHSAVTASLTMSDSVMKLKFGAGSDGGSLEEGLKNKLVLLKKDENSSKQGYAQYVGDVLTIPAWKEYRTVEVRFKSDILMSKSTVRLSFAFSNEHQINDKGYVYTQYGMICQSPL